MKSIFLVVAIAGFLSAMAQVPGASISRFIQRKGDSLQKTQNLPGLFVALAHKGQRHYFSFGYAMPAQKKRFDSLTVFEAGSISKTLTAFAVESVLQTKNIADTSSILPYLPDSVQQNAALQSISFRSLLNHTSGLPRLPANISLASGAPYDNYTEAGLFAFLKTARPQPNGQSNYSNLGAGLAGVLAAQIVGKPFGAVLNEHVWEPLQLVAQRSAAASRAQGFLNSQPVPFWNMAALWPAGGWQCNAVELLNYLLAMAKPPAAVRKQVAYLLKPTVRLSPQMQVALGWHTLETAGKPTLYWHNGGTYGFSSFAAFVPGTQTAVLVVANRFDANEATDGLGIAIMQRLLR